MDILTGYITIDTDRVKFKTIFDSSKHEVLELTFEDVPRDLIKQFQNIKYIDKICCFEDSNFYVILYKCNVSSMHYSFMKNSLRPNSGESKIVAHLFVDYEESINMDIRDPMKKDVIIDECDIFNEVMFSFTNIDKVFSKEKFNITQETRDGKFTIEKEKLKIHFKKLEDKVIFIDTNIPNLSGSPYDISINQEKIFNIRYNESKSIEEIYKDLNKIKVFFEFLFQTEIELSNISFWNIRIDDVDHLRYVIGFAKVIYSRTFTPYTKVSNRISSTLFNCDKVNVLDGLQNWLMKYELLNESISIWVKTIYNSNKNLSDEIIWYCQSLELLCNYIEEIYKKAELLRNPRQKFPNIRNYINAIQDIYDLFENYDELKLDNSLTTINDVRNKCIHNNPKLVISKEDMASAVKLLKFTYVSTIFKLIGIKNLDVNDIFNPKLDYKGIPI